MFERILVPTDGSPAADAAVDAAIDMALSHSSVIEVLHVIQTERVAGMPLETTWVGITDVVRDEGEATVEAVAERAADAGVDVTTHVVAGTPSREIVRYARESDCDLIVMGTAGRDGLGRLLLGSVTEHVVRRSPIPVLTIRRQWETSGETAPADAPAKG